MTIKVLIVEDDPMVAEMNKFYLGQVEGFEYAGWAQTTAEALTLLEQESFDLLLLDIYMKDTNGLDLLAEIRHRSIVVDVIIISAASDKISIQQALHNGIVDYLIKPFEFNRFRTALTAYQERNLLLNSHHSLAQAELDALTQLQKHKGKEEQSVLAKGFTKHTLRLIWKAIETEVIEPFSSEDIAGIVGISRVSAGKYLTVMTELGVLNMEPLYGTIGRPVQKYSTAATGKSIIKSYIE